jgi:hypothetical protein
MSGSDRGMLQPDFKGNFLQAIETVINFGVARGVGHGSRNTA